jgi:nitrate reductase NapD
MNISGVLVLARPSEAGAVKRKLAAMPGVEVHAVSEQGRLVVTVEEDGVNTMADTVAEMQYVPGVLSAVMIYHHYEDEYETGPQHACNDPVPAVLKTGFGNEEASK